jgi:hypothetical protein
MGDSVNGRSKMVLLRNVATLLQANNIGFTRVGYYRRKVYSFGTALHVPRYYLPHR